MIHSIRLVSFSLPYIYAPLPRFASLIFHLLPSSHPSFSLTPPPPQFESLDPALHDAFDAYLRERGVDSALAGFVPRYALWKEQRVSAVCVLSLVSQRGRVNGRMA
jgi:complement component 1 Q subcomponent-binding protein